MNIVEKGFHYFREEGFARGMKRVYRETIGKLFLYMSSYIFEINIQKLDYHYKSKLDIDVKQLTEETAHKLLDITYDTLDTVLEWLRKGERCFIAEHETKIVSFVWAGYGNVFIPELQMSIPLNENEFYMYNGLTLSQYRRYGLQKEIISYMLNFHRENGFKTMMVSTSIHNTAAIGVVKSKFKGEKKMIITLIRLFGIPFHKKRTISNS